MSRTLEKCRICGNPDLAPVLDLGTQALTGLFPRSRAEKVAEMPLELVKCTDESDPTHCGLLQLRHTADLHVLYGDGYGYRSSLNSAMAAHLQNKVKGILEVVTLQKGDIVVDIGSNDGTLLKAFPSSGVRLVGVDPTAAKFQDYYPDYITVLKGFFSPSLLRSVLHDRKAKIITSIAMFYDLEEPLSFMQDVADCLDENGLWVLEQSYMPQMLKMRAYDTVCHEHLEYYALKQIKWMADRVGLTILDVEFNDVNGGSFSIRMGKAKSPVAPNDAQIHHILALEKQARLQTLEPYARFRQHVLTHRQELRRLLDSLQSENRTIFGYGASTKGNVLLQFCRITERDIPYIADVNADKFGSFTPGTGIPIIPEDEARRMKPDCFLVLPWHFRDNILRREEAYLSAGGSLLFPLPSMEIVSRAGVGSAGAR